MKEENQEEIYIRESEMLIHITEGKEMIFSRGIKERGTKEVVVEEDKKELEGWQDVGWVGL